MSTDDDTAEFVVPDTETYREQTREVRTVTLPVTDLDLPVYHVPPGRLMAVMESHNLATVFGPGEADLGDVVDDGEITMNAFMRDEIVPQVCVDRTNLDRFHWNDNSVARDPDVADFDLSALEQDDLGALVRGIMGVTDDLEEPEDRLTRFRG
jgi:hypothetical protein